MAASSSQFPEAMLSITEASVPPATINEEQELGPEDQADIYRGEPASPPRSRPASVISSFTSSSSSSSGWSVLGLRRGALGAILEKAINRWARASSDTSSFTSSSTSLRTRMPRRRTRRSSVATSHHTNTENIIRARRKAWEQGRALPREFVLFLPSMLTPEASDIDQAHFTQKRRVLSSTSLPFVLSQLDSAFKRSARQRRKLPKISPKALEKRNIDSICPQPSPHTFQGGITDHDKNKTSEDPQAYRHKGRVVAEKSPRQPAWWLDVSSPTWSDMREIGKLLHLHPLTLEDILHQEPREKLEVFPRLGYYFIVFRALDSELTRSKAQTQLDLTMKGDKTAVPFTDSGIGATNVYIVVFREGICTFHFEDISNHTLRVRNRIMQFEENFRTSSDWIAHGILDSIVDQFFPLVNSIEREVKAFDNLVLSITGPLRHRPQLRQTISLAESVKRPSDKTGDKLDMVNVGINEKTNSSSFDEAPMWLLRLARAFFWGALHIRRLVPRSTVWKFKHWPALPQQKEPTSSPPPLMRMASTRRLVTSLTRLLGTKLDVVSQIQKRMTANGLAGPHVHSPELEQDLAGEVDIYLGDIQDHILSLQQSLAHYERMLSHSHPVYLSHVRISLAEAKAIKDHKLVILSLLSVAILAKQVVIGLFSTNVNVPRNNRHAVPVAPFHWFIGVIAIIAVVSTSVVLLARYWWRQAERKYARARQSKFLTASAAGNVY